MKPVDFSIDGEAIAVRTLLDRRVYADLMDSVLTHVRRTLIGNRYTGICTTIMLNSRK